jgi:hypothetical protein
MGKHARALTRTEHRELVTALVLLSPGLSDGDNKDAIQGLGGLIRLFTKAVYERGRMTAGEWKHLDRVLHLYREQVVVWETERTDHAGISADELAPEAGAFGELEGGSDG